MDPEPSRPQRSAQRSLLPSWLGTVLPAILIPPPALVVVGTTDSPLPTPWVVLIVVAVVVVVALRHRFPLGAAATVVGLAVLTLAFDGPVVSIFIALVVVVFSAARLTDRRTSLIVAGTAALVVGGSAALLLGDQFGLIRSFIQVCAMVGFAAAAGDATRSRAAVIQVMTERARRAEESLESEARRRVAEERLTIARDLHDVMAHQIAVINLHANVASQALRTRPDDAERSLFTIREAARTVLGEIESLLRVLRVGDPERAEGDGTAPVPDLADLDRLVADFERSGLRVDLRRVGDAVEVAEPVGLAAYRIIQEALTNAHKHGNDASALLQLEYDQRTLEVTVTNTVYPATSPAVRDEDTRGHGLVGARERAAGVRGELETTFGPGPVHRLTARLPLPSDSGHP